MIRFHTIILLVLGLTLFSCDKQESEIESKKVSTHHELWVDKTEVYLPVTKEWTNRVEVADLNGDQKLDILFANGGNYAEPGTLESSRIFINKGPENKFQEITNQGHAFSQAGQSEDRDALQE